MSKFIYVSVDVESDGPIPGINSMLSLGAAAFDPSLEDLTQRFTPVATYEVNIKPLKDAVQDPETMKWWNSQPEAWEAATRDAREARVIIPEFHKWLNDLPGRPIFVGYPSGFDFTFVHVYNTRFAPPSASPSGKDPFGFSAVDIKSYAAAYLGVDYPYAIKRNMPKPWFKTPPGCTPAPKHTHKALDDAIGQGILFLNILDAIKSKS
jgi:hypothetical protein